MLLGSKGKVYMDSLYPDFASLLERALHLVTEVLEASFVTATEVEWRVHGRLTSIIPSCRLFSSKPLSLPICDYPDMISAVLRYNSVLAPAGGHSRLFVDEGRSVPRGMAIMVHRMAAEDSAIGVSADKASSRLRLALKLLFRRCF